MSNKAKKYIYIRFSSTAALSSKSAHHISKKKTHKKRINFFSLFCFVQVRPIFIPHRFTRSSENPVGAWYGFFMWFSAVIQASHLSDFIMACDGSFYKKIA